jgi:hypothetical protein
VQVAPCDARGKTTREFIKKIQNSSKTTLSTKSDNLLTFSKPNIHFDHIFTQNDIEKLNMPMLSAK